MKKIHQVHLFPSGKIFTVEDQTALGQVLTGSGLDFPCGGRGVCGNCQVELLEGNIGLDPLHQSILERKGLPIDRWRLACLSHVTEDISIRIPEREQVILSDEDLIGMDPETGYTVAVDLGSTTVVVQLVDRMEGKVIFTHSEINEQNRYGADIIARIAYALKGKEFQEELTQLIRKQIGRMIRTVVSSTGIAVFQKIVLVGNSAMHHLFSGLDVKPLSAYPFQSPHNERQCFRTEELEWPGECEVCFLPNISHFVGSDILSGILDVGMVESEKWTALIDLGTNGELVIGNRDRIVCTSTAAGPAFEGVNITEGMRAITGAIAQVDEKTGRVQVIGNAEASGICGSGLVDAMHYFLCNGMVLPDGQIADEGKDRLALTQKVSVYDKDIREFQLAKAAISTGWDLLLKEMGLAQEDIEVVYVSGGMGNYLNLEHAGALGLLKSSGTGQLRKAGNTALSGCRRATYEKSLDEMEKILGRCAHFCLETSPDFQDIYCNNLFFM